MITIRANNALFVSNQRVGTNTYCSKQLTRSVATVTINKQWLKLRWCKKTTLQSLSTLVEMSMTSNSHLIFRVPAFSFNFTFTFTYQILNSVKSGCYISLQYCCKNNFPFSAWVVCHLITWQGHGYNELSIVISVIGSWMRRWLRAWARITYADSSVCLIFTKKLVLFLY